MVWTDSLRYSLLYHSFGTVWSLAFVMATADVIIAGAVAHWYFTAPQGGERRVEVSAQAPWSALLPQLRVRSCRH